KKIWFENADSIREKASLIEELGLGGAAKLIRYAVMLIFGLSLTVYGVIDLTVEKYAPKPMTDAEIVKRAEELGMVSIKDKWIESQDQEETED
ncbi:hypothetical protein ADUPG1_002821, partial [Aduncisulcus paluster]